MKNFLILILLSVSSLSAQDQLADVNFSVQATYGGNYAIVDKTPYTGINFGVQTNLDYPLEDNFGLQLTLGIGYSSLSSTFKSTVANVGLGFKTNNILSLGVITQFMDKSNMLSMGGYMQLDVPITTQVDLIGRGRLIVNVLDQVDNPTVLDGAVGVKYKF